MDRSEMSRFSLQEFMDYIEGQASRIAELEGERDKFEETLKRTIAEDLGDEADAMICRRLRQAQKFEAEVERLKVVADKMNELAQVWENQCNLARASLERVLGPQRAVGIATVRKDAEWYRNRGCVSMADTYDAICDIIEAEASPCEAQVEERTIGVLIRIAVQPDTTVRVPTPREMLVEMVRNNYKEIEARMAAAGGEGFVHAPMLKVELKDCGGVAVFATEEEIPYEDVPCPCGNPNHWLIKYEVTDQCTDRATRARD